MDDITYTTNSHTYGILTIIVLAFIVFFLFYVYYKKFLISFIRRKNYIKMEMGRSEGEEYLQWKRRLKRHYIRSIPFIGKWIWRRIRKKDR